MDIQHEDDKVLHQDAVEEVVKEVLSKSPGWREITIPKTLDGWTNSPDNGLDCTVENGVITIPETGPNGGSYNGIRLNETFRPLYLSLEAEIRCIVFNSQPGSEEIYVHLTDTMGNGANGFSLDHNLDSNPTFEIVNSANSSSGVSVSPFDEWHKYKYVGRVDMDQGYVDDEVVMVDDSYVFPVLTLWVYSDYGVWEVRNIKLSVME